MSTPVRGGADGPLGYAPPRARHAGTARANTALDSSALPELTPPRVVTSLRDDQDPALPRDRDAATPRSAPSLRETLSSRDGLAPRDSRETSPLRDALPSRDGLSRDPLGALGSRDPLAALAPRDPLAALAPREGSSLRDALSRDGLEPRDPPPTSLRDALSARDPLSRDAATLRPPAAPRDGLAARDPLSRDAASLRQPVPPRDGMAGRDDALPARDAFSLLDPQSSRDSAPLQGARSGEIIAKTGPRSLLDEAADFGLAPSKENIALWETDPSPSRPPAVTPETPWKRKRRPTDVFEGDAALKELRTRLAAAPTDHTPEPPQAAGAPAKTPIFVSAVRLTGVVGLAAFGALGFLWITSPQGPRSASPQVAAAGEGEVTRVLYNPTTTAPRSAAAASLGAASLSTPTPPSAPPVEQTPEPSSQTGAPWSVAALTSDSVDKAVEPPVVPQPHIAGPPPRPAATVRSIVAPPPAQPAAVAPAPVVAAPPPPPVPAATPAAAAVQLDRDEINAMLTRARTFLSSGDVAAARVVLRRAALSDDPQATLALAGTYDPTVLKKLGIMGFHADPAQARQWYSKAAMLGSTEASVRLDQMAH